MKGGVRTLLKPKVRVLLEHLGVTAEHKASYSQPFTRTPITLLRTQIYDPPLILNAREVPPSTGILYENDK